MKQQTRSIIKGTAERMGAMTLGYMVVALYVGVWVSSVWLYYGLIALFINIICFHVWRLCKQ